jgi:microsomal dipeptidase-like Zn-dependent dipeptidase
MVLSINPSAALGRTAAAVFLLWTAALLWSDPAAAASCGGDGERACCAGTFEVVLGDACDDGNVEVAGCSGDCLCGGFNPFGIDASGTCKQTVSCGGEGERACCFALDDLERNCAADLIEVPGCTGNCLCGDGTGQRSSGTCARPTSCGGPGERACCAAPLEPTRVEIQGACRQSGDELVDAIPGCSGGNCRQDEISGCSGDCSCGDGVRTIGVSNSSCMPVGGDPIGEPGTAWTAPAGPRSCELRGFADLHIHLNAHLAHGGNVFAGQAAPVAAGGEFALDETFDVSSALSPFDDAALHGGSPFDAPPLGHGGHGLPGDTVGDGTKDGAGSNHGAPMFNGWPTWTSTTHQQTYYKWLERAFRSGMRLTTMIAVTNEALCKSSDGTDCANSMGPIDDQIDAAWDFERFIDERCAESPGSSFCVGEPGSEEGWFRIVTTPLDARRVISEGKLAVVLGIEVDNLFNCKEQNGERPAADCPNMRDEFGKLIVNAAGEPIDTVAKAVAHYHDQGVRHIFPIHNFDNAFGAAATWQDLIGAGNAYSEQRWWAVENCGEGAGDYGYALPGSGLFDLVFLAIVDALGFGSELPEPFPVYSGFPACNLYGLNLGPDSLGPDERGLGLELLMALMDNGMLIDIDHMSNRSLDHTLALTRQYYGGFDDPLYQYPLVASHVQFFDLHERVFEGRAGRHERMRTREQLEAIRDSGGMIAAMTKDDVQDTDLKGRKFTVPYTEPLFGAAIPDDCHHSSRTFAQAYQYAVDVMGGPVAFGSDFNGIAGHVGPRFGSAACGGDIPIPVDILSNYERSAQLRGNDRLQYPFTLDEFGSFDKQQTGYKRFDFNVDGLAHVGLLPDLVKDMENIGLEQTYLEALFGSAEEYIRVWERASLISALATGEPLPEAPPSELSCPRPSLCQGEDDAPPQISCPQQVTQECTGLSTVAEFGAPLAIDGSCGAALVQGCVPASSSDFPVGDNQVSCWVTDGARNTTSCDFSVIITDTELPLITAPADIVGEECTSPQGASPELGQASASDVCDAAPVISNDATPVLSIGTTTVVWSAIDSSGNRNDVDQLVEVVDTTPPSISCPADILQECTGNQSATVTPDVAMGEDLCSESVALSRPGAQSFGLGVSELTYAATDSQGLVSTCNSNVVVQDTTPPAISAVTPSPQVLWPPDHELVSVTATVSTADTCDSAVPVCRITNIASSEPLDGQGDGSTDVDWQWDAGQRGTSFDLLLRAEREGSGTGRVYTIDVACEDEAGNVTTAQSTVLAPKNNI